MQVITKPVMVFDAGSENSNGDVDSGGHWYNAAESDAGDVAGKKKITKVTKDPKAHLENLKTATPLRKTQKFLPHS